MFAARFLLAAVAVSTVASQANPLSDVSAFVAIINSSNSTCSSRPACASLATAAPPCYGFVNNITQEAQCICTPAGALAFGGSCPTLPAWIQSLTGLRFAESCARCVAEDPCPNTGNAPLLLVPRESCDQRHTGSISSLLIVRDRIRERLRALRERICPCLLPVSVCGTCDERHDDGYLVSRSNKYECECAC
jgi:hypothetical protein